MIGGSIRYRPTRFSNGFLWHRKTVAAVVEGRRPRTSVRVDTRVHGPESVDIELFNDGETCTAPHMVMTVSWDGASLIEFDTLHGFSVVGRDDDQILLASPAVLPERVVPDERWTVGRLRFDGSARVAIEVDTLDN